MTMNQNPFGPPPGLQTQPAQYAPQQPAPQYAPAPQQQYAPGYQQMPQAPVQQYAAPQPPQGFQQAPPAQAFQQTFQPMQDATQAALQALQGLQGAAIESRHPWLEPNGQFDHTVQAVRLINGVEVGVAFIVELLVHQSSIPTCAPGAIRAFKIDGFKSPKAQKFAFSDLKQFMCTALTSAQMARVTGNPQAQGITPDFAGDWIQAAIQMVSANLAVGARIYSQTSLTKPGQTSGKSKLKALWFPAA